MAQERKKIGLLLASIHTGISQNVWSSFVDTAAAEHVTLFLFPGGRLNARQDFEYLRNPVYFLANNDNLDGCISWSSSIRYNQTKEEFERFHAGFEPLPYVTLAFKMPDHLCVDFDSYNGMKTLITHCIQRHEARKIAFLRGPVFHLSAQTRYQGYCDALHEASLAVNATLITDPFDWEKGEAAAVQLFEGRSLIPGRDFDTLAASSDMMALGAIDYFARKGYHIPDDYRATGFNNSAESRITESPLSTVHLPYAELSVKSLKILLGNMRRGKNKFSADVELQSEVIIRESCGCAGYYRPQEHTAGDDTGMDGLEETLLQLTGDYLRLDREAMDKLAAPVIHALLHEKNEQFFDLFEKTLMKFFNAGKDPEIFLKFLDNLCFSHDVLDKEVGNVIINLPKKIRRIEPALYRSMVKIREQHDIRARYEKERWNTVLNSLKCDLLGTRDRSSLIQSLAVHLPKIGISTAAIALYNDEKTSTFIGGFSGEGISPVKEQCFPARLLIPDDLKSWYSDGVFMVQPLFIENRSLGYFVHNVPIRDGVIFEELRSSISYALKGIFLQEEAIGAQHIAERAEQAKTEFTQVLENGLHDLALGVTGRLESLEKKMASGREKRFLEDLRELKSFVNFQENNAGSILDFTLARIDDLSLKKTMFDPGELLPNIGNFPLLSGDTERLTHCFSLLRGRFTDGYSAALTYGGLAITFHGKAADTKTRKDRAGKGRQLALLFAERIIRMHKGDFSHNGDYCTVTLPWTTLTGQEFSGNPVGSQDYILVLSDPVFLPGDFFTLPQIRDYKKNLPGRPAFIVWDAAGASPEDLVKVAGLRRNSELAGIPFLCYGMPRGAGENAGPAASLIDAVEFALKSPKKGVVLLIGHGEWGNIPQMFTADDETHLKKISIDSMAAFNETVSEITPLLIVFNTLDIAGVAAVRRHPLTVMVPILMISERIHNSADVTAISQYSRLILCHHAIIDSPEFRARVRLLIEGDDILSPHTGALVKKAILYFDQHAKSHISRWKLANTVNASEDYLTRIFHKEMGLSLWDYLNRYRIFLAVELLRQTDDTIQDIAYKTGFQDQAYFCRVFKKIYGLPPGQLRKQ